MELKKLNVKAKKYWLTINLIWSALIALTTIIVFIAVDGVARKIVAISLGIPALLVIALLIVFPFLKYRYYSCRASSVL